jgi:Ran GTPase-activating protein (RanGAP) involved in mRNA processing and transport
MTTSSSVFSLKGQSLKCDSADSIDPHLQPLIADQDVQVVVFGGNTFGVGACEQIGIVLKDKEKLKVCWHFISDVLILAKANRPTLTRKTLSIWAFLL